jgi:hypothetical protein
MNASIGPCLGISTALVRSTHQKNVANRETLRALSAATGSKGSTRHRNALQGRRQRRRGASIRFSDPTLLARAGAGRDGFEGLDSPQKCASGPSAEAARCFDPIFRSHAPRARRSGGNLAGAFATGPSFSPDRATQATSPRGAFALDVRPRLLLHVARRDGRGAPGGGRRLRRLRR